MRPHIILRYIGLVLLFNAIFLFVSSLISALNSDSSLFPLLYSAVISALFGTFPLIFVPPTKTISNKEGFIIVLSSWLLSCLVGCIPYILWGGEFSFTNAWFESVSGFTTTGSTILTDIEALPKGLLFWRSSTHWIGGIGIIIFVLSVLPSIGSARMTLYRSEMSSLAMNNFHYRTHKTIQILAIIYVGLTFLETLSLLLCGMNLFDAITHSFATIATGGFSPKNLSIAFYKNLSAEIVIMIFMILSGIHFGLLFVTISGNFNDIRKSSIVMYYLLALLIGTALTAVSLHGNQFESWTDSLRYSAFQIISVGTSTGFATADSSVWPMFAKVLMIFFTLQCACAGSTSGGIKVDRIVIFWKSVKRKLIRLQYPNAVVPVKVDKAAVSDETVEMCLVYIIMYLAVTAVSTLVLTALGTDGLTAFSGTAATLGNVGPGFGAVGSISNYSSIPEFGKWIFTANMLLGRLEIFVLIMFFMPRSWR
ncbi:MAG: TrkH family potassium uptake protein [Deltaproteobacteria bacterium]|nr:TrkH family potassium uptake protein [Deltaproteobacteria bacterium]